MQRVLTRVRRDRGRAARRRRQSRQCLGRVGELKHLLQSPFTLHSGVLERIGREAVHARAGKPARIVAKMNALNEPQVIRALYEASRAGVEIDLVVRGACTLLPGIEGVSDRIRVRSVVGHADAFFSGMVAPLRSGSDDGFAGGANSTCWVPNREVWPIFAVALAGSLIPGSRSRVSVGIQFFNSIALTEPT